MLNIRLAALIVVIAVLGATAVAFAAGNATSSDAPQPMASDWFERHPELVRGAQAMDLSDYYLRHPGSNVSVQGAASDWFERHPEVMNAANAVDLSDYFQRHPTALILSDAGATDYFQRHPDSLRPGNVVDLSDWFQRHPGSISR